MGKPFIDLTNQTFNFWTVTGPHKSVPRSSGKGSARTHWFCTCQCGNTAWIDATNLRQGISQSCGCRPKHVAAGKGSPAALAAANANYKHGGTGTRLYRLWAAMKTRCDLPSQVGYKYYGGKGISYCPEWKDFAPFKEFALANGYNDFLTIERIDNSKNYSPENCRFCSKKEQQQNTSRNVWITETLSVSKFSQLHSVPYDLVWHAFHFKKSFPEAFDELSQLIDNQVVV